MIEITGEMRHIIFNEVDVEELERELKAIFIALPEEYSGPGWYTELVVENNFPTTYKLFKTLRRRR